MAPYRVQSFVPRISVRKWEEERVSEPAPAPPPGPRPESASPHIQDPGPNGTPVVACEERTGGTLPSGEVFQEGCSGPGVRAWGSEALGFHFPGPPAHRML